ncbi:MULTISPECIES: hypothetical protein [unclassified Vibrio]|uniref:hypothetical protein n=1 Tax=unclassified Vibrio TaxID=2614977 RepID=UPI000C8328BB|nr:MULTISPECIES: hypothetical protein [unclassified Vibrio]PMK12204.1 hypothetical protein BCU07_10320 [Vibrio sp. 10N.261.54.E10]TKG00463.1 hypothetical protein FCV76_14595 [Vibrio sp. F13]
MYYLKKNVIGNVPVVEIKEAEYLEIIHSNRVLRCGLSIEEKFEIMNSNLKEFELDVCNETMLNDAFRSMDYNGVFNFRILIERRLANLLTSTKTYVDQIPSAARDSFHNQPEILKDAKKYFNEMYDASFEYRFMEMIRNHVQHNGIAIHTLEHASELTERGVQNKVMVFSTQEQLAQNSKNKKATLKETPESVDLLQASKVYVSRLTDVHHRIRSLTAANVTSARKVFESAIARYESAGGDCLGLTVFTEDTHHEPIQIALEFDDVRLMLLDRNKL